MPDKVKKESARDRRRRAIGQFHDALLSSPNMVEACRVAGISPRTGARWIRTDAFAEIYSEKRRATLQAAGGLLKAGSIGSIETLTSIAINPEAAATARVAAAKAVLDSMLRVVELNEVEERLAKLEATAQELKK